MFCRCRRAYCYRSTNATARLEEELFEFDAESRLFKQMQATA
jgi:hypothetical protein